MIDKDAVSVNSIPPQVQLTSYSPDCLEKLSEKGHEQRSNHEFGWLTEAKMDRKAHS